jgi:membrane protein implicated in regulation of membrane protease activity
MRRLLGMIALVAQFGAGSAWSQDRMVTLVRSTLACTSWAAWRESVQASLTPTGARMSRHCPIRIAAGSRVIVVDDDAGHGAAEVRRGGKTWFVDGDKLK